MLRYSQRLSSGGGGAVLYVARVVLSMDIRGRFQRRSVVRVGARGGSEPKLKQTISI
jgi:hypothetical protein